MFDIRARIERIYPLLNIGNIILQTCKRPPILYNLHTNRQLKNAIIGVSSHYVVLRKYSYGAKELNK